MLLKPISGLHRVMAEKKEAIGIFGAKKLPQKALNFVQQY